jgi:hypothetical protein
MLGIAFEQHMAVFQQALGRCRTGLLGLTLVELKQLPAGGSAHLDGERVVGQAKASRNALPVCSVRVRSPSAKAQRMPLSGSASAFMMRALARVLPQPVDAMLMMKAPWPADRSRIVAATSVALSCQRKRASWLRGSAPVPSQPGQMTLETRQGVVDGASVDRHAQQCSSRV